MNQIGEIIRANGLEWIAQPINFTPDIMSHYYAGDCFLDMNMKEEMKTGTLSERVERAGVDGFLPALITDLKWIIGEGNYKFSGYGFGDYTVSFYFMIRKAEYEPVMNKIKFWAIAKDLDEMISYDLKKVQPRTLA